MPTNIDWLGDGWTYYTDDERKQMAGKKPFDPTDIISFFLPGDVGQRIGVVCSGAASLRCMVAPIGLAQRIARSIREGRVDDEDLVAFETLIGHAQKSIRLNDQMGSAQNN